MVWILQSQSTKILEEQPLNNKNYDSMLEKSGILSFIYNLL
nr:MAG TPA: hypothetical protein [Crassvirales sp.]